ncbi:MAG: peptidylprolyl isomerase [Rickettsiales bacterium]|nr:peptidylprolyl isomerase [Rickettsiales bacterium]
MKKCLLIILFCINVLFFCNNICAKNSIKIAGRGDFDIIATIGEFVVTKYDLNNLAKVYNTNKSIVTNVLLNDVLENYIDVLSKRIIAENAKVTISEVERGVLWSMFSNNLDIDNNISIDRYCKDKKIDKDVLLFFLESNFLWLKYIETILKPSIKVVDNYVIGVAEYMKLGNKVVKYNLSEIVLNYGNREQKELILKKMNDIYKKLNNTSFETIAFSMSKSLSAKNNGLIGWVYEKELNKEIVKNIKNVSVKSFSKPFCIGDNGGSCFIFRINEKSITIENMDEIKLNVRNYIFNQLLETKIREILNLNKSKINIIYR